MRCNEKSKDEKARSYKQINKLDFNSAVIKNAQHTNSVHNNSAFQAAVHDADLKMLIASGNPQLFYMLSKNLISCSNHNSFFYTWFSRCLCFLWINSSTCEQSTRFFTSSSGLNIDSLFGPVLGTCISPGSNHLVYRIHCPLLVLVTILIFVKVYLTCTRV